MVLLFLSGRLWWPTDVQGASSYGRRIYGNWLCPSRATGHLHTRQQICAVDAKCVEQQAIESRLNCLAECDSTVIFTIIRKLNVKNKSTVVLLSKHKLKQRAHIRDLPIYLYVAGASIRQLIWQHQQLHVNNRKWSLRTYGSTFLWTCQSKYIFAKDTNTQLTWQHQVNSCT